MAAAVLFAFVLFVMGGATAYLGDRLGSYIGKKRRSSFGLRPRHTAMLWTVVSGGAIAVVTLLLLLALDGAVKTALLQGAQLIAEKSLLEQQNRALTRRNLASEQQAQADNLRAVQAQAKADRGQQALLGVSAALGRANVELSGSRVALQQRQAALAGAQQQLLVARSGLGGTRQDLKRAEARVRAARQGVLLAQKQYQAADAEVVRANRSVLNLVIKQDQLHAENNRLVSLNRAQQTLVQASQGHALIFRRDEELGRTVVSATQPLDSVRRELAVFLDGIELTARQRGAGGLDNSPAVAIPALGEDVKNASAAREAALDALSENIVAQGGFMPSIVVVADARYNTFRGETVKLDLRPYANVMVFTRGMVIATGAVDGGKSEDVILKQLQAFLTGQVRAVALDRGIIPIHDPQSGEPLVGQPIESEKWLALVKQIQQVGPNARVTASAVDDTYSADLLRLDLEVTPGDASKPPATTAAVQE